MGYFNSLLPKFLFWALTVLVLHSYESQGCIQKEKFALLEIKNQFFNSFLQNSPNHPSPTNESEPNCCLWDGVYCEEPSSGHITELTSGFLKLWPCPYSATLNMTGFQELEQLQSLDLSELCIASLDGAEAICRMRSLLKLDLSYNEIHGRIPDCIGNLNFMTELFLQYNSFTGNIPSGVCNMTRLQQLHLSNNEFDGSIPSCIGSLDSLGVFDLTNNSFTGNVPPGVCNFRGLDTLSLSYNYFTGNLPECIWNLPFGRIELTDNQFGGNIPSTISNATSLEYMFMSGNLFVGKFSLSLLSNHSGLVHLDLSYNMLDIETEDSLWMPSFQLEFLILSSCNLNKETRTFPKFLSHQYHLLHLILFNNSLAGSFTSLFQSNSQPQNINLNLTSRPTIESLDLSNNKFSGKLPENISFLLPGVEILDLSSNSFEGHLPRTFEKMKEIIWLKISDNNFGGELPMHLFNNSLMFWMSLSNNNFQGQLPQGLSTSSGLEVLDLRSNQLEGTISSWIGQFSDLSVLQLANNMLQGILPIELCQLRNLNILDIANNQISGSIPPCLKDLSFGRNVTLVEPPYEEPYVDFFTKGRSNLYVGESSYAISGLDLSSNQFSGLIPQDLGYLTGLYSLNLSHNELDGFIPTTFSMLANIETLDLSYNNLSGPVPSQLSQLNFLEVFNVSYNNLSGRVPTDHQFGTFGASSYEGNPLLSGYDQGTTVNGGEPSKTAPGEDAEDDGNSFDWRIFFWSFGPAFIIFLLGSIAVFYNNPRWLYACLISIETHIRYRLC